MNSDALPLMGHRQERDRPTFSSVCLVASRWKRVQSDLSFWQSFYILLTLRHQHCTMGSTGPVRKNRFPVCTAGLDDPAGSSQEGAENAEKIVGLIGSLRRADCVFR